MQILKDLGPLNIQIIIIYKSAKLWILYFPVVYTLHANISFISLIPIWNCKLQGFISPPKIDDEYWLIIIGFW